MIQSKIDKKCVNCVHAGELFEVSDGYNLHCYKPKYEEMANKDNAPNPWETLREVNDVCEDFKLKIE